MTLNIICSVVSNGGIGWVGEYVDEARWGSRMEGWMDGCRRVVGALNGSFPWLNWMKCG